MKRSLNLVYTAMLTALVCVATMIIRVPTIGTNGYVNIGDTMVMLSAWMLGGPFGAAAAGIGSGLADLLAGYAAYVPGTTIIKALMGFAISAMYIILKKIRLPIVFILILSGFVGEVIMVAGYFLYESSILGYGLAAAASIPSNIVQGVTCLVLGAVLATVLSRIPMFKGMFERRQLEEYK